MGLFDGNGRRQVKGRSDFERLLWMALWCKAPEGRRGLPFVLVGKPGTAKTSILRWLTRLAGLRFEVVIASLRDPSEFLGTQLPRKMMLTADTQHLSPDGEDHIMVTDHAPPNFAINAAIARRAVVCYDEVNTCPPAVQASLLRGVFEGVIGDLPMPPNVRTMLAMNAVEDAAGGWDIAAPLANRLGWLQWPAPDAKIFTEFLMGSGTNSDLPIDPRAEEAACDAEWPAAWSQAVGAVAGFLNANGAAVHRMPPSGSKAASEAWPSLRTWEFATCVLSGGQIYALTPDAVLMGVGAYIGDGTTRELFTWIKNNDLPDPAAFLDGKVAFTHSNARLDRTAAVLASCTSMVVRDGCPNQAARIEALWKFHAVLTAQAADVAFSSVVALCKARKMIGSNTAYQVLSKMEPVLTAAGVTPQ